MGSKMVGDHARGASSMTNLAAVLKDVPADRGGHAAIRHGDLVLSYAELAAAAGQIATFLHNEGVGPGDRVGVMLPNVAAFPVLSYGVLAAGAVLVPMNPLLKGREVEHYLGDSSARLIFAWEAAADEAAKGAAAVGARVVPVTDPSAQTLRSGLEPAADWAAKADDDDAVILYTSGTTGTPKGAQLTHGGLRRNAALLSGACLTVLPRFAPDAALSMIARDGVTVFEGVPTMYSAMLHSPAKS